MTDLAFLSLTSRVQPAAAPVRVGSTPALIDAADDVAAVCAFLNEFDDVPNTQRAYRKECIRFLLWTHLVADLRFCDVRRAHIDRFAEFATNPPCDWIACRPVPQGSPQWRPYRGPLSQSSLRYALLVLQNLFTYLVQARYLEANPFALVRKGRKVRPAPSAVRLRRQQLPDAALLLVREAIAALPDSTTHQLRAKLRARLVFLLFLHTGARLSEISSARTDALLDDGGRWWLEVVGKGKKVGTVPITDQIRAALAAYRGTFGLPPNPEHGESLPLVTKLHSIHEPITDNMVYRVVRTAFGCAAKLAEERADTSTLQYLNSASTHWLRHTTIGRLVAETNDLVFGQRVGRHENIATTAGYARRDEQLFHDRLTTLISGWF